MGWSAARPRNVGAARSSLSKRRGLSTERIASKLWLPDGRAESQKYGYPQGGSRDADECARVLEQAARALSGAPPARAQSPGDGDRGRDGLSPQGRAAMSARHTPAS